MVWISSTPIFDGSTPCTCKRLVDYKDLLGQRDSDFEYGVASLFAATPFASIT
jgi:hypothetical protein